jgi:hypothetical protein
MNGRGLSFSGAPDARAYVMSERRMRALRDSAFVFSPQAVMLEFMELRGQVDADVHALKVRLFTPSLGPIPDHMAACRWIATQHRRLARVARRIAQSFARLPCPGGHTLRIVALALHYMGESAKGTVRQAHHCRGLHALMKIAIAGGRHREEIVLEIGGRPVTATPASLYFRALMLARLAGGELDFARIEILDEWMWNWMPAMAGVDEAPQDGAWRADLDSNEGLRQGSRPDAGCSLYLPQAPLEAARLAIVAEIHRGRTVPAGGPISQLPLDDHIAVLDVLRRGLRMDRREPVARAKRYVATGVVELHVGLAAVMAKGFALGVMPPQASRMVHMVNVSDTGIGFEGEEADCAELAVEDLVALRLAHGEPLVLGEIVRCMPAASPGRIMFGVRRISSAARPVRAFHPSARAPSRELSLLFVPGDDADGRRDTYLTTEGNAAQRDPFEIVAGDETFTLRFDRVRDRGRGWVMTGFDVSAARRESAQ